MIKSTDWQLLISSEFQLYDYILIVLFSMNYDVIFADCLFSARTRTFVPLSGTEILRECDSLLRPEIPDSGIE